MQSKLSAPEQYSAPSQVTAAISHLLWLPPRRKHLEESLPYFKLKRAERELMVAQEQHPSSLRSHQSKCPTENPRPRVSVNHRDKGSVHGLLGFLSPPLWVASVEL